MAPMTGYDERETLAEAEAKALEARGVLAMDPERVLPLWFDGRFLTARDLNREQRYVLARQTAVGKSVGRGVIEGLEVAVGDAQGSRLRIQAGQGITFDGSHVILPRSLEVNLADLALQDQLNAVLGLSQKPGAPIAARTGLFVLALRALEYTANATTSFPTHVTGERTTHMGDRIEAVAVTLTPFAPIDAPLDAMHARALAASRIFAGADPQSAGSGQTLPLAMLALRSGSIEWLDVHLVRRDLVASKRDLLGLGLSRDQLRLAHFRHYRAALDDVVRLYRDRGQAARFNAEEHFRLLPAAGPVPAACIDPAAQTQLFFPGEMEVELSIVPEDELAFVVDDSFELPPIDLTRPPAERDAISIMILAPVPRHLLRSRIRALGALSRPLRPIALLGQGPLKPIDRLSATRIALADVAAASEARAVPAGEAWAALLRELTTPGDAGETVAPYLWYVRRRTLRENALLESVLVPIDHTDTVLDDTPADPDVGPGPEPEDGAETPVLDEAAREILARMSGFGDLVRVTETVFRRQSDDARAVLVEALSTRPVFGSPILMTAATLRASEASPEDTAALQERLAPLTRSPETGVKLLDVGLFGGPSATIGITRLEQLRPFVTGDDLARTLEALPAVPSDTVLQLLQALDQAIATGRETVIAAAVERIEGAASPRVRPFEDVVIEERGGGDLRHREAEAERARRAEAAAREALLDRLADPQQQEELRAALARADDGTRRMLIQLWTAAEIERSRIATSTALDALRTSGALTTANLRTLHAIDRAFVDGLVAVEPHLLARPVAAPTPVPANSPAPARVEAERMTATPLRLRTATPVVSDFRVASTLAAASLDAGTVEKRIDLLTGNAQLRPLAAFGRAHAADQAALKAFAAKVIPALDAPRASRASVAEAIQSALRE
ncbi:MAG: hypothetical protein EA356_12815 [Geminicoccaceae bacterium]|nr:MAG: hypothetical protein EA356_12815 [Geminicoccaceae bacterium]